MGKFQTWMEPNGSSITCPMYRNRIINRQSQFSFTVPFKVLKMWPWVYWWWPLSFQKSRKITWHLFFLLFSPPCDWGCDILCFIPIGCVSKLLNTWDLLRCKALVMVPLSSSVRLVISLDPSMSRAAHPQKSLKMDVEQQLASIPLFTFYSELIDSVCKDDGMCCKIVPFWGNPAGEYVWLHPLHTWLGPS